MAETLSNSPAPVSGLLPWLVAVAFFMESLDTTILNTAVPSIAEALRVAPLSMKSVLSSYTLSLAVFIPISGWMADRFGTRRVFAAAIGVFTLGSFLCGISTNVGALVFCRILQGFGGAMMVPVGRLTLVRSFAKSELIRVMNFVAIPALVGPLLGPLIGGLIVGYFNWRVIFFVNVPIGLIGLSLVYLRLPDYREERSNPLDTVGFATFGCGVALLSYVLEVFGEHTMGTRAILGMLALSLVLLASYGFHAARTAFPLLQLALFRIRSFRGAVAGGFVTRLGVGGIPFLLPLLYQVGLGFTPVQSGLLIMPQALTAISLKLLMPKLLTRFGYRTVLISNTILLGLLIALFASVDAGTPVWLIVIQACCYGFFSSMQFTSMNTLVYADLSAAQSSGASTVSSTMQQMSISFGVACASLVTALFVPDRMNSTAPEILDGIHKAFLVLGALTMVSTVAFTELKSGDGDSVSRHNAPVVADTGVPHG